MKQIRFAISIANRGGDDHACKQIRILYRRLIAFVMGEALCLP
ncbi:hypothetical protein RLEG12_06150 (plasmid) [Rhizobium leguminosarum bv. trifolii CB782]|nr:hypothetical protein RLEG12_06150 [Rhizobium leguminosarum bv. trifolii CB782]